MKRTTFLILYLMLAPVFWAQAETPASAVTAASAIPAAAAPSTDPLDDVWEQFTKARRVYQIRLCELASRRWPEFAGFFKDYRDLQLAYIERRSIAFYNLKKTDPARIVRDKGGEAFLQFSWSEEDEKRFLKEITGYQDLSSEIERLKSRTDNFKKRDLLRDRFSRLEIDPEYLALMRDMTRSILEAERALSKA